jgi:hypothetical protein
MEFGQRLHIPVRPVHLINVDDVRTQPAQRILDLLVCPHLTRITQRLTLAPIETDLGGEEKHWRQPDLSNPDRNRAPVPAAKFLPSGRASTEVNTEISYKFINGGREYGTAPLGLLVVDQQHTLGTRVPRRPNGTWDRAVGCLENPSPDS